MKNNKIILTILIVLILAIVIFWQFREQSVGRKQSVECLSDTDCKLIYSSCDCEAVSVNDKRDYLKEEKVCVLNYCHLKKVKAVCLNFQCQRSDKTK